jgi:hypothetical protein
VPPGHQKPSPAARYHSLTADPPGSNGGCTGAGRPPQASAPATSRLSPSRPPRATLEELEGMAKGVRLGGPRGGGLGGRLVWRPGILPLFAEERRGDRGKTRRGGLVGESDWGGHAGEVAAGKGGSGGLGGGAILASSFP